MAKDKKDVEVEPDDTDEREPYDREKDDDDKKRKGQQTLQTPYGVQDMNAAVEPDTLEDGIDGDVERVLTDEVHVDMGRGALTFKPGDKITIRNGHIVAATTREGMEYEFKPAHELHAEERRSAVDAENLHQNLSAKPHSTPDTPSSPATDPTTELQLGHEGTGAFEETEEAITSQPESGFDEDLRAEQDAIPVPDDEMPAAHPEGDTAGVPEVPAVGARKPTGRARKPETGALPQAADYEGEDEEPTQPIEEPDKEKPDKEHPHGTPPGQTPEHDPPGQKDKPQPKQEEPIRSGDTVKIEDAKSEQPREKGKFAKKED